MDAPLENLTSDELMTVDETAKFLKTTTRSLYIYLCNSGKNGGQLRPRLPKDLYVKLGRKTLFIKPKLIKWLIDGAKFV